MSEFDKKLKEDIRKDQEFLEQQLGNLFNPVRSKVNLLLELVNEGIALYKETNSFAKSFSALEEFCKQNAVLKTEHLVVVKKENIALDKTNIKQEKHSLHNDSHKVEVAQKENVAPPRVLNKNKNKIQSIHPKNSKQPITNKEKENKPKTQLTTKSETPKQVNKKVETLIKIYEEKKFEDCQKKTHTLNKKKPVFLTTETPLLPPDCLIIDKKSKKCGHQPQWFTDTSVLDQQMTAAGVWVRNTLFSVRPMTLNLQEIIPSIEIRKLKRTSSAIWTKRTRNTFGMSPVKECGSSDDA